MPLHPRRRPPQASRQARNRPAAQGTPHDDDEQLHAGQTPLSGDAKRVIALLDGDTSPDDGDEESGRGQSRSEERRTGAQFRALTATEVRLRTGRTGALEPLPSATNQADSAAALARQLLGSIERHSASGKPLGIRAALLARVRALLETPPSQPTRASGMAGVRALLIDSTNKLPSGATSSECAEDLRCLLPILLLNLERPRTRQQTNRAVSKLQVLGRTP